MYFGGQGAPNKNPANSPSCNHGRVLLKYLSVPSCTLPQPSVPSCRSLRRFNHRQSPPVSVLKWPITVLATLLYKSLFQGIVDAARSRRPQATRSDALHRLKQLPREKRRRELACRGARFTAPRAALSPRYCSAELVYGIVFVSGSVPHC